MMFRFAHFADVHLRQSQYGHEWRGEDFRDAWLDQVDRIVMERDQRGLDFVTFGGDLFEKAEPKATPFSQALEGLQRFKDVGLPVIGIKGNHDIEYPGQQDCWVDLLADQGYLKLIDLYDMKPVFLSLEKERFVVGVYGIPYSGQATVADMVLFSQSELHNPNYRILLMHAGLEGILPGHQTGTFKLEEARQLLKPKVDLLLLGHIHKPYQVDGWIYNPGSFEARTSREALWLDRGIFVFEVDTETRTHQVYPIHHPNRHWIFVEIDTTEKDPHQIKLEYLRHVGSMPILAERIVHVTLTGQMDFPMSSIDFSGPVEPKLFLPDNQTYKTVQVIRPEGSAREEIEDRVLAELTDNPVLAKKVMQMALAGALPEAILKELSHAD